MPDPKRPPARESQQCQIANHASDLENRSRPCDELGTKLPLRFSTVICADAYCSLKLWLVNGAGRLWNTSPILAIFFSEFFSVLRAFSSFTLPILIGKHLLVWLTLTSNYPVYCIFLFLKGCALSAFICHYYAFSAHKVAVPVSIPQT